LSLNLQDVISDPGYNSDLTLTLNASGTGLQWDRLNGEILINLSESRLGEYHMSADSVRLALNQQDPLHKEFVLESTVADFSLKGAFDVAYLARLLPFEVANIQGAVAERLHRIDSTRSGPEERATLFALYKEISRIPTTLDATYTLRLKNLEPISAATGNRDFNGSGVFAEPSEETWTGSLSTASSHLMSFSMDSRLGVLVQDGAAHLRSTA